MLRLVKHNRRFENKRSKIGWYPLIPGFVQKVFQQLLLLYRTIFDLKPHSAFLLYLFLDIYHPVKDLQILLKEQHYPESRQANNILYMKFGNPQINLKLLTFAKLI